MRPLPRHTITARKTLTAAAGEQQQLARERGEERQQDRGHVREPAHLVAAVRGDADDRERRPGREPQCHPEHRCGPRGGEQEDRSVTRTSPAQHGAGDDREDESEGDDRRREAPEPGGQPARLVADADVAQAEVEDALESGLHRGQRRPFSLTPEVADSSGT
jgi:hypothetical protein